MERSKDKMKNQEWKDPKFHDPFFPESDEEDQFEKPWSLLQTHGQPDLSPEFYTKAGRQEIIDKVNSMYNAFCEKRGFDPDKPWEWSSLAQDEELHKLKQEE